jgi:hypothetical protein
VIVAPWRRLLVDHDFALGCPPRRDHLRRVRQRQPPHPCQRVARTVASASRRRLHQVWGTAGGSESTGDGADGRARRRPSYSLALNATSSRSTQSNVSSRRVLQTHAAHRISTGPCARSRNTLQ